jgi:hypothetical protein
MINNNNGLGEVVKRIFQHFFKLAKHNFCFYFPLKSTSSCLNPSIDQKPSAHDNKTLLLCSSMVLNLFFSMCFSMHIYNLATLNPTIAKSFDSQIMQALHFPNINVYCRIWKKLFHGYSLPTEDIRIFPPYILYCMTVNNPLCATLATVNQHQC